MSKSRRVVTEADVRAAVKEGRKELAASPDAIITPLARDVAKMHGVKFVAASEKQANQKTANSAIVQRKVIVGSDHGGYECKMLLKAHLHGLGWTTVDVGTDNPDSCDYPDFAFAVAKSVIDEIAYLGIMIDGAGVGSSIVCNKVPGIRAALGYNEFAAWNARAHNDANILTLGSRTTGIEVCKRIVNVFLETSFEGGRHASRVSKISDVESRFSR